MDKFEQLLNNLEKGGKPAQVGEIRDFSGVQYQKMADGNWKPYIHPEEKKLEAEQNKNKVVSLTDKLKTKIEEKKQVSASEQHVSDLQNQGVVPNQKTRSEKPMFTNVDQALSSGYSAQDFREVGNFFYDRAQKMAENIDKLKSTKQEVDPNFEKIKKINMQYAKAFISQANHIDDRQTKTKAGMKKSIMHMGHNDTAEVNTASYAIELDAARDEGWWLEHIHNIMEGYQFGDIPRMVTLPKGDLYLVRVDDGMYSGLFKQITPVENGVLEDNAKVRLERMSLPTLINFCLAKEWLNPIPPPQPPQIEPIQNLTVALQAPVEPSQIDKKIQILELLNKLVN